MIPVGQSQNQFAEKVAVVRRPVVAESSAFELEERAGLLPEEQDFGPEEPVGRPQVESVAALVAQVELPRVGLDFAPVERAEHLPVEPDFAQEEPALIPLAG